MTNTSTIGPADCADALATLRERSPLVQCLTNIVVAQWTANVLLADDFLQHVDGFSIGSNDLTMLNRLIDQQAFTMAVTDLFWLSSMLFFVLVAVCQFWSHTAFWSSAPAW